MSIPLTRARKSTPRHLGSDVTGNVRGPKLQRQEADNMQHLHSVVNGHVNVGFRFLDDNGVLPAHEG